MHPHGGGVIRDARQAASKVTIPLSERPTLTVDEFCSRIGIGRSTFYKTVKAGDLKIRKYGKRTFVTKEGLQVDYQ
jgi:excisionase family DNA binding protein